MKAILKEDMIVKISNSPDAIEIGDLVPEAGLERLRFDGTRVTDLMELSEMWVRYLGGRCFELHAVEVPDSQFVKMGYRDRKYLINEAGVIRVLTEEETAEREEDAYEQAIIVSQYKETNKTDPWIQVLLKGSPEEVEAFVDKHVTDLASTRAALKRLALAVGYCLRKIQ